MRITVDKDQEETFSLGFCGYSLCQAEVKLHRGSSPPRASIALCKASFDQAI